MFHYAQEALLVDLSEFCLVGLCQSLGLLDRDPDLADGARSVAQRLLDVALLSIVLSVERLLVGSLLGRRHLAWR